MHKKKKAYLSLLLFFLSCLAFGFNNCKVDKVESQTSSSTMTHTSPSPNPKSTPTINPSPIQSSTPTINPSPNPEANQSLIEAVWEGNISKVRDALNNGANINFRCNDGYASTALMVAVRMGDIEIVELLLEAGANVNAQDINGKTALMWTSSIAFTYYLTYWPAITKMNLCTGLPCNDTQGPIRENEQNVERLNIAKLLLEAGANVNLQDKIGKTALYYARSENQEDIVRLLKESGATE